MVDELERRLRDAISSDVDSLPVEVTGLVSGARRGARRIRRRRVVGTAVAAVLVVVAVPLGAGALTGRPPAQQVAASPTTPTPSTSPSASAEVPAPPTASPVNPDVPAGLAGTVLVPPEALLDPADLPFAPVTTDEFGPYVKNRTLTTPLCGDGAEPGDELAVGGREISHSGQGTAFVTSGVRVFTPDGARQQLDFLREALGTCDYAGVTYAPQDAAGLPGDEALIGTAPSNVSPGGTAVVGAVRDGATTTGFLLDVGDDEAAATALARDLLTRAHERLVASGLPAAHPG